MGKRMVIAAVLGGVALFLWGFLSHAVLGLGDRGIRGMPNEEAIMKLVQENAHEHGLYFLPFMPDAKKATPAETDAWTAKVEKGPYVLMVVKPDGSEVMSPMMLVREFATCLVLALIAVFLIVAAGGLSGLVARVIFCVLLALFGLMQHDMRFWNWYRFPGDFTEAQFVDKLVGGILLGIVIHFAIRRK